MPRSSISSAKRCQVFDFISRLYVLNAESVWCCTWVHVTCTYSVVGQILSPKSIWMVANAGYLSRWNVVRKLFKCSSMIPE